MSTSPPADRYTTMVVEPRIGVHQLTKASARAASLSTVSPSTPPLPTSSTTTSTSSLSSNTTLNSSSSSSGHTHPDAHPVTSNGHTKSGRLDRKYRWFLHLTSAHGERIHPLTLRFRDAHLERNFRVYNNEALLKGEKIHSFALVHAVTSVACLLVELATGTVPTHDVRALSTLVALRVLLVLLDAAQYGVVRLPSITTSKHVNLMRVLAFFAALRGVLLLLLCYCVDAAISAVSDGVSLYHPTAGQLAICFQLMFYSNCLNFSGMRFVSSMLIVWPHLLGILAAMYALDPTATCFGVLVRRWPTLLAVIFLSISSYDGERQLRAEYLQRRTMAIDRERHAHLLRDMLPDSVLAVLASSSSQPNLAALAEPQATSYFVSRTYPQVTILFCYIADFGDMVSRSEPLQLVRQLNVIFTAFDLVAEEHKVFKVESIAEQYLLSSGCPIETSSHCQNIADAALAMQRMTALGLFGDIKLKIGIHTGIVTAGVVGRTNPSYHLFGDTVNTTSRVCSTCPPGRIQVSPESYGILIKESQITSRFASKPHQSRLQSLVGSCDSQDAPIAAKRAGGYELRYRGHVKMKGKGRMRTYYLIGKYRVKLETSGGDSSKDLDPPNKPTRTASEPGEPPAQFRIIEPPKGQEESRDHGRRPSFSFEPQSPTVQRSAGPQAPPSLGTDLLSVPGASRLRRIKATDVTPRLARRVSRVSENMGVIPTELAKDVPSLARLRSFDSHTRMGEGLMRDRRRGGVSLLGLHNPFHGMPSPDTSDDESRTPSPLTPSISPAPEAIEVDDDPAGAIEADEQEEVTDALFALSEVANILEKTQSAESPSELEADDSIEDEINSALASHSRTSSMDSTPPGSDHGADVSAVLTLSPSSEQVSFDLLATKLAFTRGRSSSSTSSTGTSTPPSEASASHLSPLDIDPNHLYKPDVVMTQMDLLPPAHDQSLVQQAKTMSAPTEGSILSTFVEEHDSDVESPPSMSPSPSPMLPSRHVARAFEDGHRRMAPPEVDTGRLKQRRSTIGPVRLSRTLSEPAIARRLSSRRASEFKSRRAPSSTTNLMAMMGKGKRAGRRKSFVFKGEKADFRMHKWTMAFVDRDLETKFERWRERSVFRLLRRTWAIGLVFCCMVLAGSSLWMSGVSESMYVVVVNAWRVSALGACAMLTILHDRVRDRLGLTTATRREFLVMVTASLVMLGFNVPMLYFPEWDQLQSMMAATSVVVLCFRLRYAYAVCTAVIVVAMYIVLLNMFSVAGWFFQCMYVTMLMASCIGTLYQAYRYERSSRYDFLLMLMVENERDKVRSLLTDMLPHPSLADQLLRDEPVVHVLPDITYLYSDIKGFTALSSGLHPHALCGLLDQLYSAFDDHLRRRNLFKIDTIGDAYLCVGGLVFGEEPEDRSDGTLNHTMQTVLFGVDMFDALDMLRCKVDTFQRVDIRIGVHVGKGVGGCIGLRRPRYLIWGTDALVANKMESLGTPGAIHVTQHAYERLTLPCEDFSLTNYNVESRGRVCLSDESQFSKADAEDDEPVVPPPSRSQLAMGLRQRGAVPKRPRFQAKPKPRPRPVGDDEAELSRSGILLSVLAYFIRRQGLRGGVE